MLVPCNISVIEAIPRVPARNRGRKPLESICDEEYRISLPRKCEFGSARSKVAGSGGQAADEDGERDTVIDEICKCLLEDAKRKCSISRRTKSTTRRRSSSCGTYTYIISEAKVKEENKSQRFVYLHSIMLCILHFLLVPRYFYNKIISKEEKFH